MQDDRTLVDEKVDARFESCTLSEYGRVWLPRELVEEHSLRDVVVDVQIVQGESSAAVMDAKVSQNGKLTVPAKKRQMYGFTEGEKLSGVIDRVVMR